MKKSKKNSIAGNILHLFYSTALASGLNAVSLIILASYLESYYYGLFSVVLAFAMIMGYFTDAGLSDIACREGSKKEVDVSILISSYVKMRLGLLAATFLVGFVIIHLSYPGKQELIHTAYFLIFPMVTGLALQSIGTTYFQLIEKMQFSGLIRIVSSLCLVLTLLAGMLFRLSPLAICTLYGLSYLAAGIFGIYLVRKNVPFRLWGPFHKGLLNNLGAFTLGGLLYVLMPQLGPLILEKTISLKDVGLFAIAYRIPQALQQIPFIVAGAYYPVMFRTFHDGRLDELIKQNISLIKMISIVGMAMTIPLFFLSDLVIDLLFGDQWVEAGYPLKVLSILLTLQAVNIALADGLTTRGLQTYRTTVQVIAICFGAFFYLFFSRAFGVAGAAFAGVMIEGIALLGYWLCIPNRLVIAKRVMIPYLAFFAICLGVLEILLGSHPILAVLSNYVLLAMLVFLDKENREKMRRSIQAAGIPLRWKAKRTEEG